MSKIKTESYRVNNWEIGGGGEGGVVVKKVCLNYLVKLHTFFFIFKEHPEYLTCVLLFW